MPMKKSKNGYHWPGDNTNHKSRKSAETARAALSSSSATWTVRWPAKKGTERKRV